MESGERLGEVLIRRALVSEDDIARGLAAQQGLAFLHPEDLTFDSEVTALLPTDEARSLGAVAVRLEGDGVLVITPDPSARQRDRLEARLGQRVIEAVVSRGVFDGIVERLDSPGEPVPRGRHPPSSRLRAGRRRHRSDSSERDPARFRRGARARSA